MVPSPLKAGTRVGTCNPYRNGNRRLRRDVLRSSPVLMVPRDCTL